MPTDLEAAEALTQRLNHPWSHTDAPLDILVDATEAVHAVHYAWARTVEARSWRDCHSCQTYAVRAVEVVLRRS